MTVCSQEAIDESDLFKDSSSIVADSSLVNNTEMSQGQNDKKSVSFSGEITSTGIFSGDRDLLDSSLEKSTQLTTYIVGNIFLDIRQFHGIKAFANLETRYLPSMNETVVDLRELFLDANIGHRLYFRTGKQVLQWGRCYFWNPTDLINVEKKLFIQKIGYREGAYGIKTHVPFGTRANLYGFVDTRNASGVDSVAGVAKAEFLLGGVEMAFSVWDKSKFQPVFGYDFSTSLL